MKKLTVALQALALAGGLTLAIAAPAQATPSNCQGSYTIYGFNTWAVRCFQGTGKYQAKARCYSSATKYRTVYGAVRQPSDGQFSVASCSGSEDIASGTWVFV
ncbi:hypothetical protein ACPFP2_22805 [Micromonospora citrea]|uniref:hypothetical protein n=1 Tax=Micromonospora citrea TaxID=47855 RepID=UPI003C323A6E